MKTLHPPTPLRLIAQRGFTLLEMVGVIAVMAIMAAVVVPNALRNVDHLAVQAEAQTLNNIGTQAKYFFQLKGWLPGTRGVSWDQELSPFVDLSPTDLVLNKRQISRVFIYEPSGANPPKRLLVLSVMHLNLPVPTAGNLGTLASFDAVWNTIDGQIPGAGWGGWATWRTALRIGTNQTAGDYLVIQRVNLDSLYSTVKLTNNSTGTTPGYQVIPTIGNPYVGTLPRAPTPTITLTLRPNEQLNLYNDAGRTVLSYTYVASSGVKNFGYTDANHWQLQ
ncbi:MAG: type II secretion system protein [Nibricoccus sp.]